ncbi:hypothetical protein TCAL_01482 [Tigriopus californicus]|uniref:Endoplasmic reticulum-Golgi intermediate compartment protein 3 n=2 Tax=Tigriopus californicus TaxID=6832 RepID=A0A553N6X6_TIGCA|nr:hypothetical protein TCAL_01482 [Tigriopus californicus]
MSGLSGLWSSFKRLDAYPKTLEDFRIQTFSGGTITVLAALLMAGLFASEIIEFQRPEVREEIFVDTSRGLDKKLKINFDVIIHHVSCSYLSLDAMDVSGEQHIGIQHHVFKRRLDLDGKPLEDPVKERQLGESAQIVNKTKNNEIEVVTCGSCYGAETAEQKCCNTCNEVKQAYSRKTWKFDPRGVDQCKSGATDEEESNALKEGCQMYGYLEVNRVGGSFHFGPGKSFSINHVHVHDVQPFTSSEFNLTHTIRHLSFGQAVQSSEESALDGVVGFAEKGGTMFQYYLKVVPTTYIREEMVFPTNQYSVTRHQKVVSLMSGESGMPGVFFSYELAPFMVKYSEKQKSLGHFLTGLCAIIGGVFTVAGILDKLVYSSSKIILQKMELGKATFSSKMREYGDEHRIFLQGMMCRGIADYQEILKLLQCVCVRCNLVFPNEKKDQARMLVHIVQQINTKLDPLGLLIDKVIDEDNKARVTYFGLFNKIDRSQEATELTKKAMVNYNPGELEFLKLVVENIMDNEDKELESITAINLSRHVVSRPFKALEAESVIQKLVDDQWLKRAMDKSIRLSPRFIGEMEHYLKENFAEEIHACALCKKIVIRAVLCNCSKAFHLYCLASGDETKESQRCPKCKFKIELPNQGIVLPSRSQAKKRGRKTDSDSSDSD